MDFLTQLLMGQTAPFTGTPGQAGFPQILDPMNKLGGLRTQVLPDPLNPQAAAFPDQPLGAMLQPQPNPGAGLGLPSRAQAYTPTTSATNDMGQPMDEQGNPLPTYGRGERPFGNSRVFAGGQGMGATSREATSGGYTPPASNTPPADTGSAEAGGMGGGKAPFATTGNKLLDTLRGVVAPQPPRVQTVGTPNLPPLRPIEGGDLIKMLASLGIGPQQAMSMKLGRV